jgi:hypothetical protein
VTAPDSTIRPTLRERGAQGERIDRCGLTVLGDAKDSLWSFDLFRCESAVLRTHSLGARPDGSMHALHRGFAVHRGVIDGMSLCRVFNQRLEANPRLNTSAPIMIPCIGSTYGRPIC